MHIAWSDRKDGVVFGNLPLLASAITLEFLLRIAIDPFIGDKHQYVPAYAAMGATTWLVGWRAGALTALACLITGEFFAPVSERDHSLTHDAIAYMAYIGMSMAVISAVEWVRHERAEARRATELLREADRRKSAFMALLGHELRNPLETLAVGEELLQRSRLDPQVAERALLAMQRQTRHMAKLVEDLLDVSRLQTGKLSLSPEVMDAFAAVQGAVVAALPAAAKRQQRVVVTREGDPGRIYADPHRLEQMLVNLVNNASKFSPVGSPIEVTVRGNPAWVSISVTDHGAGIEASQLQRIFDPFVARGDDVPGRGLGLGLPLTRELAEMHGGSVRAFSAGDGHGSEFLLSLPRAHPAARQQQTDAPPSRDGPVKRIGQRVLVVEDNEDAAATLALLLRLKGHFAVTANSGHDALALAATEHPDIAFVDIALPDMSGLEVARNLRHLLGAAPALVALTGWASPEDRDRSRAAGFDAHLVKPIDGDAIDDALALRGAPANRHDEGGKGTQSETLRR